ncbi:ATP-binding protein [Streptomyces cavernicola]|uniref:ATP-binding protein n=1 Tax=Streptomyces cavernicola TaxID=3043613 RepID=A0ABT6SBA4_9ACTN|nr:ATP-binding protein [Streptomyces sp. B-S-A6]MDI3405477.1 ATP-binding protein [Streptomyces sp. B-S-A6]
MRLTLTLELPAHAKAVPEVRRVVREHLGNTVGSPEVQLCVSELLTNVVQHVGEGTPVTIEVSPTRVAVSDPDPHRLPVPAPPQHEDPGAESGRGLALLAAVSTRWGVTRRPDGKTVWCELQPVPHQAELSGRSAACP